MSTCTVCGRKLTSKRSIAAGVGPKCGRSGGRGKRHAIPRLSKLGTAGGGLAAPVARPMPITEALAAVRQIAKKSPTWEVIG